MTREEFEQYAKENGLIVWSKEMSEKAIKALEQEPTDNDVVLTYDMYHELIADRAEKLEQEPILDELRAEITTLQNRCYALTKGTMCAFCKYECEYKAETEAEDG